MKTHKDKRAKHPSSVHEFRAVSHVAMGTLLLVFFIYAVAIVG